ncbi:MAG: secondary thiamine-phosphate synthase enzyme YjbQ [Actinomycetota bacterium]|jgi:secondary thiamine-phosphate synthase enzyme|nr:secondary thiamine-phosphate synthase enzyme YjbQ [Actinomycetota bacterium]MDD5601003.1 secondary thiamine-phosphate synthase enzyme YjbQ [Actinomycetota bacterium]
MKLYHEAFELQSKGLNPTFHDVTEKVKEIVEDSGIKNGICVVYSQHTTCSIILQECSHDLNLFGSEYLQQDLVNIMEKIIPTCRTEGQYMHPGPEHIEFAEKTVGEEGKYSLNTDAHLRSVFFGRSESIILVNGELQLGQFGYIYMVDWDQVRARKRVCQVQIIGE